RGARLGCDPARTLARPRDAQVADRQCQGSAGSHTDADDAAKIRVPASPATIPAGLSSGPAVRIRATEGEGSSGRGDYQARAARLQGHKRGAVTSHRTARPGMGMDEPRVREGAR